MLIVVPGGCVPKRKIRGSTAGERNFPSPCLADRGAPCPRGRVRSPNWGSDPPVGGPIPPVVRLVGRFLSDKAGETGFGALEQVLSCFSVSELILG